MIESIGIKSYVYNEGIFFSDLNSNDLLRMAEQVNRDWKFLARDLGLTENDIISIEATHQMAGPTEHCFQVLHLWVKRNNGTKFKLAKLLKDEKFFYLIEKFNLNENEKIDSKETPNV